MYTSDVLGESSMLTVKLLISHKREKHQSKFVSRVMSWFISRNTRPLVFLADRIGDAGHSHIAEHQGCHKDVVRVKESILFERD